MVDLPKKKVGIISCSGEDLPGGTIARTATLKVLEELLPLDTVTLCLPLFLAGDERERAFAKFYPTIAVDGCEKLCAKRATEKYSGPVASSIRVDELTERHDLHPSVKRGALDEAGEKAAEIVADEIVKEVERLLGKKRADVPTPAASVLKTPTGTACSCGSGIPISQIQVGGTAVGLLGLETIFDQFCQSGRENDPKLGDDLLALVKVYNHIPPEAEALYREALLAEYGRFRRVRDS